MMAGVSVPALARPLLTGIGALAVAARFRAFAVGGCVRDWCMGYATMEDVDIAVEGDAILLARGFADSRKSQLTVHEQFGTASVQVASGKGLRIDFAACRTESYAHPGAYPRVQLGTLLEDLARRDFALNAMAVELSPETFGLLIDPLGGFVDLRKRQLRVLHDRSFLDDPSRILRGIRFAERFRLRWEPHTRQLLDAALAQGAIGRLNAGRVSRELGLMLQEPSPQRCLRHLSRLLSRMRAGEMGTGDV